MKKVILMVCVLCFVFLMACDRNIEKNNIKEEIQMENKQTSAKKIETLINDKSVDAINPIVIDEKHKKM